MIVSCAYYDEGADEPSEREVMFVKALGLPEITETSLFAEYFGTGLAIAFGLDAPRAALVDLPAELIESSADQLGRWGLHPRHGEAVGLEQRTGMASINRVSPVRGPAELAEALLIYVFDLLVQNPDRREDNPNCGTRLGRFIAYDHEMAFSFLYPILGAKPEPWEVAQLAFCNRHIFRRPLSEAEKRGGLEWQPVETAVATLAEQVEQLAAYLPTRWEENGSRVVEHVTSIAGHLEDFRTSLQLSLV